MPTKPLNLTVLEVTATTIKIRWHEPESLNGALSGYRVIYVHLNQTHIGPSIQNEAAAGPFITHVLQNLSKLFSGFFINKFTYNRHFFRTICRI